MPAAIAVGRYNGPWDCAQGLGARGVEYELGRWGWGSWVWGGFARKVKG